jgi:hypothetical protein
MAVIAAATVVVTAMVTVVVTEGKSIFLCALRVWFGGFTLKIGPPFLNRNAPAFLHRVFASLSWTFLLTLDTAEATEMATAAAVAATVVVVVTAAEAMAAEVTACQTSATV